MEKHTTSRRSFIATSAKATLAITAGITAGSTMSCASGRPNFDGSKFITGFRQEPLSYGYNELDKAIDAMTMEIHYSKHAAAYATNLNDAAKAEGVDITKPLEDVLARVSKYST